MANTIPVNRQAIRTARLRAGLTQQQVAVRLGIGGGGERISRWESGLTVPRLDMVARLASALSVPIADLMDQGVQLRGLERLRAESGLTVREVAAHCGISVGTYERWEKGRTSRSPNAAGIADLARVFRVDAELVERALSEARTSRV